ncbi:uncharacterized protein EV422DRAFT_538906 [Fimicolochytrium jonesii]|uniref:uncharacterized protein n=1 Tax=Fimicolochytrium jonesii TaxID=1396493 RepID=UPI0022FE0F77|nr:uncharacterized protein EV422DRAFT_538906 [Fimicolochytrium jonesii]KAI8818156.1 hypothetical protein EV422DRAFT_538906 [Fimicolochytrium jonesii]
MRIFQYVGKARTFLTFVIFTLQTPQCDSHITQDHQTEIAMAATARLNDQLQNLVAAYEGIVQGFTGRREKDERREEDESSLRNARGGWIAALRAREFIQQPKEWDLAKRMDLAKLEKRDGMDDVRSIGRTRFTGRTFAM